MQLPVKPLPPSGAQKVMSLFFPMVVKRPADEPKADEPKQENEEKK